MRHPLHLFVIACLAISFAPAAAQDAAGEARYELVMLGDSLTAGFGLADDEALPAAIERSLAARGITHVSVINAGVSGDTTSGGLARFDFSVGPDADGVLIALGANDALQGQPPERTAQNILAMVERARARELDIVLAGMFAPLNMGQDYRDRFDGLFPEIADREDLPLYPFLLGAVALEPDYLMSDGMHPTAEGVELMAEEIADFLSETLFGDAA